MSFILLMPLVPTHSRDEATNIEQQLLDFAGSSGSSWNTGQLQVQVVGSAGLFIAQFTVVNVTVTWSESAAAATTTELQ